MNMVLIQQHSNPQPDQGSKRSLATISFDDSNYFSDEECSSSSDDGLAPFVCERLDDSIFEPNNLIYRGEGNCSLVVALEQQGNVIRILKKSKNEQTSTASNSIAEQRTHLSKVAYFQRRLLRPLFADGGLLHVPRIVYLTSSQVAALNSCAAEKRPRNRLNKNLPARECYALVLPDFCSLSRGLNGNSLTSSPPSSASSILSGDVIAFEIKPKQGFLPSVHTLTNELAIKASISRFCLKQYHKQRRGSVSGRSKYCPIDLFSGCPIRMRRSLMALFDTPQNNLRIFKNLDLVYGEELRPSLLEEFGQFLNVNENESQSSCEPGDSEIMDTFCNLLIVALTKPLTRGNLAGNVAFEPNNNQPTCVPTEMQSCDLHSLPSNCAFCANYQASHRNGEHCLNANCVLGRILTAQRLDTIDSELALKLANQYNEKTSTLIEDLFQLRSADCVKPEVADIYRRIFDYMVSLTAKDCSIMISLQKLMGTVEDVDADLIVITEPKSGLKYACRVAITDLDPKCPSSMQDLERKWKEKDLIMVNAFRRAI